MLMGLFLSLIVMPSGISAEEKLDPFTVDGYEQYLQNQIWADEGSAELAAEGLEKFKQLSKEEKELYLEFLSSDYYFESLNEVLENPASQIDMVSDADSTIKEFVIQFKGKEIPITYEVAEGDIDEGFMTYARYNTPVAALYRLGVFGINTTNIQTHLRFIGDGYKALSILDAYHSHANINPGVWVSYGSINSYINGRYAYARATYELRSTGSLGFLSANLHHTVRAAWSQGRAHKIDSTNFNIKSFGWTKF